MGDLLGTIHEESVVCTFGMVNYSVAVISDQNVGTPYVGGGDNGGRQGTHGLCRNAF
jgi:hypothetical protein